MSKRSFTRTSPTVILRAGGSHEERLSFRVPPFQSYHSKIPELIVSLSTLPPRKKIQGVKCRDSEGAEVRVYHPTREFVDTSRSFRSTPLSQRVRPPGEGVDVVVLSCHRAHGPQERGSMRWYSAVTGFVTPRRGGRCGGGRVEVLKIKRRLKSYHRRKILAEIHKIPLPLPGCDFIKLVVILKSRW